MIKMDKETIKPIHAKPSLYAFYFEIIKEIGKEYGYNIVLHGSMNRDLDLIAIPWKEVIGDKKEMLDRIAEAIGGHVMFETDEQRNELRNKLYGRECWVININRTIKAKVQGMITEFEEYVDPQYYIDISILPHEQTKHLTEQLTLKDQDIERYKKILSQPDWQELEYIVGLETKIEKLTEQLDYTDKLLEKSFSGKSREYLQGLESKVEQLTKQLADLQSKLTLSEEKVKLNYNNAVEFEKQLAISEENRNVLATDLYKYTAKVDMLEEQLAEKEKENADFVETLNATKSDAIHYFNIGIENNKLKKQLAEKEKELSEVKRTISKISGIVSKRIGSNILKGDLLEIHKLVHFTQPINNK